MKIVDVFESTWYKQDTDFKSEDEKDEYYGGEFWDACEYATIPTEDIEIRFRIDFNSQEVIVDEHYDYEYDDILLQFASADHTKHFIELHTGNDYKVEEDKNYDAHKPYILYRGGSGYYYYHHQYKYDI